MLKNKYTQLPLGEVEAMGFLKERLTLQAEGITGHMEEYPDYSASSGWLGGDGESWERGPYYVRGLVALAYTLKDEKLIERAYKWIDWALNSQKEDGNFGPEIMKREWWAKMPMLMTIRDFYMAEKARGNEEHSERILNFFEKYFSYQQKNLPENPLDSWAKARGGDNVEVIFWYYEEIKQLKNEGKEWLKDLAGMLFEQTEDWVDVFQNTGVRHHVVNTTQAMKTPHLKYKLTGDETAKEALKKGFENIKNDHGRIDNLPNADEAARDNIHTRGTESCAVVEGMLSMEICGAITGEGYIYDNLESYCYNSLPNAFTKDMRLHTYYQLQNEVMATQGYHGFDCDHGDSSVFAAPCGFDCCFSNSHMGYPKFVQNMWVKAADGIAAVCYGANKVETTYNGKKIAFVQETKYPFGDEILLTYMGEPCEFTLSLRDPGWSGHSEVEVSANQCEVNAKDKYICIRGEFKPYDTVKIKFNSEIEVNDWHLGGRYVKKGPLIYALPIEEDVRVSESNDFREIKYKSHKDAPITEIYPLSRWNYALSDECMKFDEEKCVIKAKGQIVEDWILSGNKAGIFNPNGVKEGELEDLELVPYGSGRLRISIFPKVLKNVDDRLPQTFEISADTAFESIFVSYSRYSDCRKYVILYGRESGKYENTIYDVEFNGYKGGGHMFQKEKYAFTVKEKGRYFIKMLAVSEGQILAESNETEAEL